MFQTFILAAVLAGAFIACLQARWLNVSTDVVWDLVPWTAVAGVLGALGYGFILTGSLTGGGMVWYGGLFAGLGAAIWRYRRNKLPGGWFIWGGAPAIALGHAIGRIGCFMVGDDWGKPTDSIVGVAFPHGAPPSTAGVLRARGVEVATSLADNAVLRVHPTQLYESGFLLLLFVVLFRMTRRRVAPHLVAITYLLGYGAWRFGIEFLRVKTDHMLFNLTTAQVISLALMSAAAVLFFTPSLHQLKTEKQ